MHAWTIAFLIVLSTLLPARQTAAQAVVQPIAVGDAPIAGSLRTRGHSWRWFGGTANGEYTYPASLLAATLVSQRSPMSAETMRSVDTCRSTLIGPYIAPFVPCRPLEFSRFSPRCGDILETVLIAQDSASTAEPRGQGEDDGEPIVRAH